MHVAWDTIQRAKKNWFAITRNNPDNKLWTWAGLPEDKTYYPINQAVPGVTETEYYYDLPDEAGARLTWMAGPYAATIYKALSLREETNGTHKSV